MSTLKQYTGKMLLVSRHLKEIDQLITEASNHTHPSERTKFSLFVWLSLWSAKVKNLETPIGTVTQLNELLEDQNENILCDNLSEVWFKLQDIKSQVRNSNLEAPTYLDLLSDCSGFEAFLDLCLVQFLTLMLCPISLGSSGVKFRIYNKNNVTSLLEQMADKEQDVVLQDLAMTWKSHVESGFWSLHDGFESLPTVDSDLYKKLQESKLIVAKGETTYCKLVGNKKWHPLSPFRGALGDWQPAPLIAIRAIKSDIIAGIEDINVFARINNNELPRDWVSSGNFGVIQYFDPSK